MELGSQYRTRPSAVFHPEPNVRLDPAANLIEQIYDDVKATLRVSVINLPFSLWASHPRLLELLWNRLKRNLSTRYVESAADRIRERAVRMVSARLPLGELHNAANDFIGINPQLSRSVVDLHHYANPKLLIATAGLLEALQGHLFEPVKDRGLHMSVPLGIPNTMARVPLTTEPPAEQRDTALLKEIQEMLGLPTLSSEYLCLSSLNGYLDRVWPGLKSIVKTETFWLLAEDLESLAALLARGLPYSMVLTREDFKGIGLSVLEARNWIIPSHMALARLVLNMAALKITLDGKHEALQSPYPILPDSNWL